MNQSLTPKQYEYLRFIAEYLAANKVVPSLKELQAHFKVCTVTAFEKVEELQRKGFLVKGVKHLARNYVLNAPLYQEYCAGFKTMSLDEAREIVRKMTAHSFADMGLGDVKKESLAGISLRDMLQANEMVRKEDNKPSDGPRTIQLICDERLIAALYVAYHYPPQDPDEDLVEPVSDRNAGVVVVKMKPAAVEVGA